MLNQPDLFSYPRAPGFKANGTSRAAAEQIAPAARTLRDQVLELLQNASLTADETAAKLDKSILSIRPRLSELVAQGKIIDTGKTRRNASGIMAAVWRAI